MAIAATPKLRLEVFRNLSGRARGVIIALLRTRSNSLRFSSMRVARFLGDHGENSLSGGY
jgi:hypothetical protein